MALAKLRVRRTPANQAHVTNRKEDARACSPPMPPRRRSAALPRTRPRWGWPAMPRSTPSRSWLARRWGVAGVLTQCAVEEACQPAPRPQGADQLCRDPLRVRHSGGFCGRRRHPLVQGVPGVGLCLARGQGPLHFRLRLRGPDGARRRDVPCSTSKPAVCWSPGAPAARGCRTGPSAAWRCPSRCRAACGCHPGRELCWRAMLDLEVASGNDALASHSDIRKTAKLMCQFIPGTDFIHSGYSAVPRYGQSVRRRLRSTADEYDDYAVVQRDMQIDAGLRPDSARRRRLRDARAGARAPSRRSMPNWASPRLPTPKVRRRLPLPTTAADMPDRARGAGPGGSGRRFWPAGAASVFDVIIAALDAARAIQERGRSACSRLSPPAGGGRLFAALGHFRSEHFRVLSAINDRQRLSAAPAAGYRLAGRPLAAQSSAFPPGSPAGATFWKGRGSIPAQRLT
jgi:hypothetical protein